MITIVDNIGYIKVTNGSDINYINKPYDVTIVGLTSIRIKSILDDYSLDYNSVSSPSSTDINNLAETLIAYNNSASTTLPTGASTSALQTTGNNYLDSIDSKTIAPNLDAFARLRISNPETIFDSKQLNDKQPLFWDDQQVSGSGTTSTYNTNKASTTLAVSNLTAGKRVRQTFRRFN